ncbi:MAG: hypothetical protein IPQ09_25475 [Myxococcales bacterium]|nr:hypothetical protein [Myxococcales bacterium]
MRRGIREHDPIATSEERWPDHGRHCGHERAVSERLEPNGRRQIDPAPKRRLQRMEPRVVGGVEGQSSAGAVVAREQPHMSAPVVEHRAELMEESYWLK